MGVSRRRAVAAAPAERASAGGARCRTREGERQLQDDASAPLRRRGTDPPAVSLHDRRGDRQTAPARASATAGPAGELSDRSGETGPSIAHLDPHDTLSHHTANLHRSRVRVADEAVPDYGIEWPEPWSVPMVARA